MTGSMQMATGIVLNLVDQDHRRRASIISSLSGHVDHIEPYEDFRELEVAWPRGGILLIHDDGALVNRTLRVMDELSQWLPSIAYRQAPQVSQVVDAMALGVMDYLTFPIVNSAIRERLTALNDRIPRIKPIQEDRARARQLIKKLSSRETLVLRLLAAGKSNKEMAALIGISSRTVEIHRANTLRKLGCSNSMAATKIAIDSGLS